MKTTKIFYALMACVLISLTACSDDDDDEKQFVPGEQVTNLSFTDTDMDTGKIGGMLSWTLPSEANITGYVVYLADVATTKGTKLGEVEKGSASYNVPAGTELKTYLQVVAKNALGESESISAVTVQDNETSITEPEPDALFSNGLFILNGGNYNENNASVSFYSFATGEMHTGIYKEVNGKGLGDSAEEALMYGSKIYVTVTTSNRLVVLDKSGEELKSISPTKDDQPMNPRGMIAKDGKIYISYYYGHEVAVLDTVSLEIENTVAVGRFPEKLAAANGKIYVTNSGGLDPTYGNTVSVIDPATLTVEKDIEVALNPAGIVTDSEGDLYVISLGDYGAVPNALQRIDAATDVVTTICQASKMMMADDRIYLMDAPWGMAPDFKIYDTLAETITDNNFVKDGTSVSNPTGLAVDPASGRIFITHFDYVSTASLYIFDKDGKLEGEPIDTGGYDSKWLVVIP